MIARLVPLSILTAALCGMPSQAAAIIGGHAASSADFPFVLSAQCNSTLISPTRVLTAAHCVDGSRRAVGAPISGFTPDGRVSKDSQGSRIRHVAVAPGYRVLPGGDGDVVDDAAILELDRAVTGVRPVRVAELADAHLWQAGRELTIVGSGATSFPGSRNIRRPAVKLRFHTGGPSAPRLRTASVRVTTDRSCADFYRALPFRDPIIRPSRMICTADPDGRDPFRSTCSGDSGSPLLSHDRSGRPVLVGITSFGVQCGELHEPSVFTEAAALHEFITNPNPTWAPEPQGQPVLTGDARVGGTVTCTAPVWTPAVDTVVYRVGLLAPGTPRLAAAPGSMSPRHRVLEAERGRNLVCLVEARNSGGHTFAEASPPLRIAN